MKQRHIEPGSHRDVVAQDNGFNALADSVLQRVPLELHGHRKKLRFILDCLERFRSENRLDRSRVRVLEVGCSNGRNITTPLALLGYPITGIDIHRESIEYARQSTQVPNARFLCQDLAALSLTEQFEVIILSDVLEHVDDPAWLCRESMKHLTKDGQVLVSIPNGHGPYELEQKYLKRTGADKLVQRCRRAIARFLRRRSARPGLVVNEPAYNYDSGHVQFFHLSEFERLLEKVELRIVRKAQGALFGGTLSVLTLGRFRPVVSASLRLADHLPMRWVTTWYFCCTRAMSAQPAPGSAISRPGHASASGAPHS